MNDFLIYLIGFVMVACVFFEPKAVASFIGAAVILALSVLVILCGIINFLSLNW